MHIQDCSCGLQHVAGQRVPAASRPHHSHESPAAMAERLAGLLLLDVGGERCLHTLDGGDGKSDSEAWEE